MPNKVKIDDTIPGPWTARSVDDGAGTWEIVADSPDAPFNECTIAETCYGEPVQQEANAKLLAAAPELRAALTEALRIHEHDVPDAIASSDYAALSWRVRAEAAIAKAEGR